MTRPYRLSRAERLAHGLRVCEVDGCDLKPVSARHKRCYRHPSGIARAPRDGSEVQFNIPIPPELMARAKSAAEAQRMSLALWGLGALARALIPPSSENPGPPTATGPPRP
jgi:hypothetical protein